MNLINRVLFILIMGDVRMKKYPECEKLAKVSKTSQKVGEFLDWLRGDKEFILCKYIEDDDDGHDLVPVGCNIENLLAEYFEIDMDKVEKERRQMQMLAELRK